MVIALSLAPGFLGFVHRLLSCWKGSTIYICECFLDKITDSGCIWIFVLSQLLILETVGVGHPDLNWQGTRSSLSSGPRPAVDMIDLLPSCDRRVQIKIWLGDRGICNWLYIYPLAAWTARSLEEVGLFFRCSGYGHKSRDCPRAGWTRVMISKWSETLANTPIKGLVSDNFMQWRL